MRFVSMQIAHGMAIFLSYLQQSHEITAFKEKLDIQSGESAASNLPSLWKWALAILRAIQDSS